MLDARRRACLEAMGIDLWRTRNEPEGSALPNETIASDVVRPSAPADSGLETVSPSARSSVSTDTVAHPVAPDALGPDAAEPVSPALDAGPGMLSWEQLQRRVSACTACDLHPTRTQTVFGVGDRNASLMVIGEAPGADEDRQGEPFVGRAGKLLNAMLEAIGFARDQVYIANIIKCRPPGNRDPHIEEAAACQPFLHRQIELIEPRLILSVGRVSAHNLLGTEEAVGRLRGRTHRFDPGNIPLIVTYHPAYLLRRPQEKAKAWRDLQAAHRLLHQA